MKLMRSWVTSANTATCPFPLNNLPYGVFSTDDDPEPRCGVAIGDQILDLTEAEAAGLVVLSDEPLFDMPFWNPLMEQGPAVWTALRARLQAVLAEGAAEQKKLEPLLVPLPEAEMHMPIEVSEFTDFYASKHHAMNVGRLFRGEDNALPPQWLHMPIGYNGRASSVVVSGTDIPRPMGQIKHPDSDAPVFAPTAKMDFELELAAIVGMASDGPLSVQEADDAIFGYVLLNDWSARDIQAWEYQPLGPFQGKACATTISPWIVTKAALEPFRCETPAREVPLLPHLVDCGPMLYDIDLAVTLQTAEGPEAQIAQTNFREMYYSCAQMLAHHSSSGCPMNVGDLLGSGTISGPKPGSEGALLERTLNGSQPLEITPGVARAYLEDGDDVILSGAARHKGVTIGFGTCSGVLQAAG